MTRRMLLIRLGLVLLWIGLGVVLFVLNRGHTLLLDNHDTVDPEIVANRGLIMVTVDANKSMEFFRNDRDLLKVRGSRHKIRIEFTDGTPVFETVFKLPLAPDMFMLSIPRIISGSEQSVEVFHSQPQPQTRNDDNENDAGNEDI